MRGGIKIGFIGLGNMGAPMARRLLAAGETVVIWGRNPAKLVAHEQMGAHRASTPMELARRCDVVITSLADTDAVRLVVLGVDGLAGGGSEGKLLIDTSTISPDATCEIAAELVHRCGMTWVDAPVSGGVPGATDGTLTVMAGGTEVDFRRAFATFRPLSGNMTWMGPLGSGQKTKLVNQMIVGATIAVLAEGLSLAEKAGINAAVLPVALAGGRADSSLLQQLWPKMAARDFSLNSAVSSLLKDFNLISEFAGQAGAELPVAMHARQLFETLGQREDVANDLATIINLYDSSDPSFTRSESK
ncbi:NAD(P)-dependent oxidoreductase [Aminobacter sp. MSH1]|uniref:NAD(P)-dependent oxidoreductase n=1 Tax=Aminobacter sp. MSH1 TaxID=374606 RepID=UPI000D34D09D|nr:NAD(P)-dependent oxidoreductase [Aminobacter sp. MSH1]